MVADLSDVFDGLAEPLAPRVVPLEPRADARAAPATIYTRPPVPFEWRRDWKDEDGQLVEIVEGLLTAGGLSIMFGESNSGKTYLALHLILSMTRGVPFIGRRVSIGAGIYIAGEGSLSVRRRVAAYEKHFSVVVGHFGLISTALNLMDPSADVEDLIALIKAKAAEIGEPILLVVVDTVARAMAGANENASEDMARFVSAADRIREETGAHVLGIHHSGKDAARGARGHSSLRAAIDTEIEVSADEAAKVHTAHITKQRDLATKGQRLAGKFVSVELGRDQWGNAVTACAVEDAEAAPVDRRPRATGPAQQAVMGFLAGQAAAVRKPEIVHALEPQGISRAATYKAINALLSLSLVTDSMGLIYRPKE